MGTDIPEVKRMLGAEGSMGQMLGLDAQWAVRAIAAEGNYAEIFDRYLGPNTALGLARGLNALYKDGGILYSPRSARRSRYGRPARRSPGGAVA